MSVYNPIVRGILVLFIYRTSVASNDKFSLSAKLILTLILLIIIKKIVVLISDPFFTFINNFKTTPVIGQTGYTLAFSKFLNYPTYLIIYLVIIYLLVTLIAVVKITNI